MLRDTEPRVHALVCFIHGGGTGVWLGFKTHLAPWALCPILRHAVGNVKPLLNIRSPPSASVFPLRWLPDSQGQGHTGGGEREGWRLPVYRKQDTKALLFRIFLCTLWGSSFGHPPHTLPKPCFLCVVFFPFISSCGHVHLRSEDPLWSQKRQMKGTAFPHILWSQGWSAQL